MVEFEERFNHNGGAKIDTTPDDGTSEVRKCFRGVSKVGNKWRARIQHPKLKYEVNLGRYSSLEEAALAVKEKKAEYEEMFKGDEDRMNVETCNGDFEGRKIPCGVYRKTYRRWGAQIRHPKLKRNVSLGSYDTVEEAAIALEHKRVEFRNMYGWKPKVKPGRKHDGNVKVKHKVVTTSEILDELTGDRKVPAGVSKMKSGKWRARIRDPKSRARIWLGSFTTVEDAVKSLNKAKAELSAKRNGTECDGFELRPKGTLDSEANKASMKLNHEFGYSCQTSLLGSDNLNSICVNDNSNHGVGVTYVPEALGSNVLYCSPTIELHDSNRAEFCDKIASSKEDLNYTGCASGFRDAMSLGSDILNIAEDKKSSIMVFKPKNLNNIDVGGRTGINKENQRSTSLASGFDEAMILGSDTLNNVTEDERLPTVVFEPENSNSAEVNDIIWISKWNERNGGCASEFDEAVSLGIINEYGQLLGIYSELDETMEFSPPDEDVVDLGHFCCSS